MHLQEQEQVRALFNAAVIEGKTYPQDKPLSEEEFKAYWLSRDAFVVKGVEETGRQKLRDKAVLGAFFSSPTFWDAVAILAMLASLYNLL